MGRAVLLRWIGILAALVTITLTQFAQAQSSSSAHYQVDQVFFGAGGAQSSSANYSAQQTLGETGIGNSVGNQYQIFGGFNTGAQPYLEFVVYGALTPTVGTNGVLDSATTATDTSTFAVRSWLSGGYIVLTVSGPPSDGTHTFATNSTPTASTTGTEQFGINLVANTSPASFGANPEQCPNTNQCPYTSSPRYSYGVAASGYDSTGYYKYVQGDTIAESAAPSTYSPLYSGSSTLYTISYIFNISSGTPSGEYTLNHVLVATATY